VSAAARPAAKLRRTRQRLQSAPYRDCHCHFAVLHCKNVAYDDIDLCVCRACCVDDDLQTAEQDERTG